jgi:hypothetical protein
MNALNRTSQGEGRMSHPKITSSAPITLATAALYKADRPRWIDYHIDFFGDNTPARLTSIAQCDEAVLGMPA